MIQRSPRQPLADIVDGIDAPEEFTARCSPADLGRDRMLRDAIERLVPLRAVVEAMIREVENGAAD